MHLRKIQGARLPPWQIVRNGKAFAQATRPLAFTVSPPYRRASIACSAGFGGRDVAQPGSASHWGCGGRRFESSRPDQFSEQFYAARRLRSFDFGAATTDFPFFGNR